MRRIGILIAALALSSCDTPPAGTKADQAPSAEAATPAAPVEPAHLWTYREGQEYGYAGDISPDDKNSGQGAAPVRMIRYLGEKGGVYTVALHENGTTVYASCANPCEVVKARAVTEFGSTTQRMTFSPATIAGAALTDAFNGRLEVYKHGAKPAEE